MPIADNVNYNPSRLLTSTETVRNQLVARNLYTPNRIYPITEKQQVQNVVNAVSSVLSMIAPFKSIDLKNTVFARLIVQQSPLSDIGLAMLGTQMAYNAGSHIAQQTLPTIRLANLFDGDKNTHLFTPNINFSITKKQGVTNFQQFLDSVTAFNPSRQNPFMPSQSTNINSIPISNNPTIQNSFYIKNTGLGQITFLINAFNQNIYKEGFGRTPTDNALQTTASEISAKLTARNTLIGSESSPQNKFQNYYNFFTSQSNPYSIFPPIDTTSIIDANGAIVYAMENPNNFGGLGPIYGSIAQAIQGGTQEYAPTQDYVKFNLGTSIKEQGYAISEVSNDWINPQDEFNTVEMDSVVSKDKLVWGRNGISAKANEETNILLGTFNDADSASVNVDRRNTEFNAYQGILEYTRNLLNASQGNLISITKKAFLNGKNVEGFNGSALWVANNSTYAQKSETAGLSGVRQHSAFDQYNRFAKAIRFNGNTEYQGNQNSVIFKSVIPRMHPTIDKNLEGKSVLNNKNLMFSIENLAVRVISNADGIGIIDDEYGSTIPGCEVGQFNGRQMWFPPYDVTIQETTNAVYESTVMVGRSEPMYAYQNSTRTATLTFTLLVDYPYQLKDIKYRGPNKHKAISEFFAFGGDPYGPLTPVANPPKKTTDIEVQKKTITGPTQPAGPEVKTPTDTIMVFPNDFPNASQVSGAIDSMYLEYQYEIENGCINSKGQPTKVGFNSDIFIKTGISGDTTSPASATTHLRLHKELLPLGFSQYTVTGTTAEDGSILNERLYDVYKNVNNRSYYDIIVRGGASKLYIEDPNTKAKKEPKYNTDLGLRRANAAIKLVRERIKALFGQYPENLNPKINVVLDTSTVDLTGTAGSTGSKLASLSTAEIKRIEENETISARYALITIKQNSKQVPPIVPPTSQEDKNNITKLNHDVNSLAKISSNQKSNAGTDCVYNERGKDTDAILNGFKSISGNFMYPVFHSQTPEDFHRRLTFLQQCMRQGAAKRFDMTDENGILRAKNSVFGRQPICILRVGDFFFTKVVINQLNIDYTDAPWDMNPEGFGMQPMLAKITLQMNIIGGQSLVGPIDALQNAISFNYYANSNFTNAGMYFRPSVEADNQKSYMDGILTSEQNKLKYNLFAPGLRAMGLIL
jgi:hypothetical protein